MFLKRSIWKESKLNSCYIALIAARRKHIVVVWNVVDVLLLAIGTSMLFHAKKKVCTLYISSYILVYPFLLLFMCSLLLLLCIAFVFCPFVYTQKCGSKSIHSWGRDMLIFSANAKVVFLSHPQLILFCLSNQQNLNNKIKCNIIITVTRKQKGYLLTEIFWNKQQKNGHQINITFEFPWLH